MVTWVFRMTKGCQYGEDTYFCRSIERCSNVYIKHLKLSLKKQKNKIGTATFIERMSSS